MIKWLAAIIEVIDGAMELRKEAEKRYGYRLYE